MDVKTVCLGLLTQGPASGYDLKKTFESTFGHFFAAGFGSIYPALGALAEAGLVTCTEVPQNGKPDRKVYRITDAGHEALMKALDNPAPAHKIRSEFLAMMFFAHLMTPEQIDTVLGSRLAAMESLLDKLDELDMNDPAEWPSGTRFVAGFGRAMATAGKKYIEEHRTLLTDVPESRDTDASSAFG